MGYFSVIVPRYGWVMCCPGIDSSAIQSLYLLARYLRSDLMTQIVLQRCVDMWLNIAKEHW